MPYCAECGARYAAGAAECPMCGAPTDVPAAAAAAVATAGGDQWLGDEGADGEGDPVERLVGVRRELIRLSAALRRLTDEDYASQSSIAGAVRDDLTATLDELDALALDGELGEVQDQLNAAARHLLQNFDIMMQLSWPGAMLDESSRAEAQSETHEATKALRAAGELLAALVGADALEDEEAIAAAVEAEPSDVAAEEEVEAEPEPVAAAPAWELTAAPEPAAMRDLLSPAEPAEELPVFAPPVARIAEPAIPRRAPPRVPPPEPREAGDDPLGEELEWEVLNHWTRHRVDFYRQIDEVVQGALTSALRAALDMRARAQRDTEAHVERLQDQRRGLLDEIEVLRHERERLREETAQLRIELERLERARTNAESEAQQMLRDARVQRARLLGEIEMLTKQLTELHRAVTSLPGLEQGEFSAALRRPHAAPERPAAAAEIPPARAVAGQEAADGRGMPPLWTQEPETDMAEAEPPARLGALEVAEEVVPPPAAPPEAPAARPAARPPAASAPAAAPSAAPPPRPMARPPIASAPGAAAPPPAAARAPLAAEAQPATQAARPAAPPRPRPAVPPRRVAEPEPEAEPTGGGVDQALADLLRGLDAGTGAGAPTLPPAEELDTDTLAAALAEGPKAAVPAAAAPSGPAMTEIRIVGPNVIRQRPQFWMAVKGLQGVRSVLPRVEEGALVLRTQHERGPDLIEDLVNLPGMGLKLVTASFPDRVELSI